MIRNYFFIFFIINILSCSKDVKKDFPSSQGLPDQESWGVTIALTDKGLIRAKVQSGHLEKFNEKEHIILDNTVFVDFYDSKENHISTLNSDKAEINERSNDMLAIGKVIAKSDSGITLFSKTLKWISKKEKFFTEDSLMITTLNGDTLYGVGFESDADLKNWQILKPSGISGEEI